MSEEGRLKGRIFVAGHAGLAGSAILRQLRRAGYQDIVTAPRATLDLADGHAVTLFFEQQKPAVVFLAAAKVGGILANDRAPGDFIRENLLIQTNVIEAARRFGVRKLLFLGSSCIYPKHAAQPLREEALLTGPLEPTNEAYATAKIAGIKMCAAYNRQYGTDFLAVMPTNLYGPGDNYDLSTSHVLPALLRKAHEAKHAGLSGISVWGSGRPRREFMHADDLAAAGLFLMERCTASEVGEFINIGTGRDLTILELAEKVAASVGFHGQLILDPTKPDGTPQKLLDVSRINRLGWRAAISLEEGLRNTYEDFQARYGSGAGPARAATGISAQARP